MQSGSIYSGPVVIELKIYPHELVTHNHTTQTKILAHLLARFIKELQTKIRKDVLCSAFEEAIKLLEDIMEKKNKKG